MAKIKTGSKEKTGLGKATPAKKLGYSVLLGLCCFILFVSLFDYDPRNYHIFPASGDEPALGRAGVFLGRWLFALFGISAWLIPCM